MTEEKDPRDPLHDPLLAGVPTIEGFKVLDKVVLQQRIGRGGMGVVYRGHHRVFKIDVAVKVLKPELAASDDYVERFRREADAALRVTHQNLVRVYDVGQAHGLHFLVMEFVDGESVPARVARWGRLRQREAVTMLAGLAGGLAEVHRAGLVHRDVKPENVLVSRSGRVKLADLGLVRLAVDANGQSLVGQTSMIMGTPQYMSPEQWDTPDVGPAADVWALGATFWFLVTGKHAAPQLPTLQIGKWVQNTTFPSLRDVRPDLLPELHAIYERCVRTAPRERFANAGELQAALLGLALHDEELLREETFREPAKAGSGDSPLTPAVLERIETSLQRGLATPTRRPTPTASAEARRRPRQQTAGSNTVAIVAVGALLLGAVGWFALRGDQRDPGSTAATTDSSQRTAGDARATDLAAQQERLRGLCGQGAFVQSKAASNTMELAVTLDAPPPGLSDVRLWLQPGESRQGPFDGTNCTTIAAAAGRTGSMRANADGPHLLRIEVVGDDNVSTELPARTVLFDSTPPTLQPLEPAEGTTIAADATVRVRANDQLHAVTKVTARIADLGANVLLQANGNEWSGALPIAAATPERELTIEFVATDALGNASQPAVRKVRYTPLPQVAPPPAPPAVAVEASAPPADAPPAAPAQPLTSLDALRQWLEVRGDAAKGKAAYAAFRDKLAKTDPLLPIAERLDLAMQGFGNGSALPLEPAKVDALLDAIVKRRQDNLAPHEALPFLLLVQKANGTKDARIAFALFEAWGHAPMLVEATVAAGEAAAEISKAIGNAKAEELARLDNHLQLTKAWPKLAERTAVRNWLVQQAGRINTGDGGTGAISSLLDARLAEDYANAVREADNAKVQDALNKMIVLRPQAAAPWLLLAMARASWGGGDEVKRTPIREAIDGWKQRRGNGNAAAIDDGRLATLGFDAVSAGASLADVAKQLEAIAAKGSELDTCKQRWFPDKKAVGANAQASITRKLASEAAKKRDAGKAIEAHNRAIAGLGGPDSDGYKANQIAGHRSGIKQREKDIKEADAKIAKLQEELAQMQAINPERPDFTPSAAK